MERIFGICSDIHGNWDALKAVIADMEQHHVSQKICLGDVVGYGAEPKRCVHTVMQNDWLVLTGNHEEALLSPDELNYFNNAAVMGVLWAKKQLDTDQTKWLSKLPHVIRGSSYELVHASLDEPMAWNYIIGQQEAERHFSRQEHLVWFWGHTHTGMIWRQGRKIYFKRPSTRKFTLPKKQKVLINVGSVGQPRDGNPRASYVLFNPESRTIQFRRVRYNIEAAKKKIIQAGLPEKLGVRLLLGQ